MTLITGGAGADSIEGTQGNDTIVPFGGSDTIFAGGGDDSIVDVAGDDAYRFDLGDGDDTIQDLSGVSDAIVFGPGFDYEDLTVTRIGDDLRFGLDLDAAGAGGSILIKGMGADREAMVERLVFTRIAPGGGTDDGDLPLDVSAVVDFSKFDSKDLPGRDTGVVPLKALASILVFGDEDDELLTAGGSGRRLILGGRGDDTVSYERNGPSEIGTPAPDGNGPIVIGPPEGQDTIDPPERIDIVPSDPDERGPVTIIDPPWTPIDDREWPDLDGMPDLAYLQVPESPDFREWVGGLFSGRKQTVANFAGEKDIVRFSEDFGSGSGIFFRNGNFQDASPLLSPVYKKTSTVGIAQPAGVNIVALGEDLSSFDYPLKLEGLESLEFTPHDDRFIIDLLDDGKTQTGTGAIRLGAGDDVALVLSGKPGDLEIDGGEGNDILIALSGEGTKVIGGLGRDHIVNMTPGGQLYGDSIDGLTPGSDGTPSEVPDTAENADHFWFAPGTTIMDPQKNDILSYYGIPLTGGDASNSALSLSVGARLGGGFGADIAGALSSAFSIYAFSVAVGTGGRVIPFFDTLVPFISYVAVKDESSKGYDVFVYNTLSFMFKLATGQEPPQVVQVGGVDVAPEGSQRIRQYDFDDGFPSLPGALSGIAALDASQRNETADLGMLWNFPNAFQIAMGVLGGLKELLVATPIAKTIVELYSALSLADGAMWVWGAAVRKAKALDWAAGEDPLIIDLDGDGIETVAVDQSGVFFDSDLDRFAEAQGWLDGDDGFLVRDLNDNGRVDDISEMFGGESGSGYGDLARFDEAARGGDGDGRITAADAIWGDLLIWQDLDQDGNTDAGELHSLDDLGILALDLAAEELGATTPQGTRLLASGEVEFADGTITRMFDAIFETIQTFTRYAGEAGHAAWQRENVVDTAGLGSITNLAVAAANDVQLSEIVDRVGAAMTTPDILILQEQVGEILSYWGQTLETTQELTPVLLVANADGAVTLADRGVYVEDEAGGYWTLASGASVRGPSGAAIDRPTLEQVMAQATADGQVWQMEQTWSPATRGAEAVHREWSAS
jgi:hypothetical protein